MELSMDTKKDSSTSDVPTFKVARVGNDRKRKGGGLSFLRGGGTRGAWSGATGGAGAGGAGGVAALFGGGMTLSNAMIVALIALGGLGALSLGRMMGNASNSSAAKPKAFSMASHDPVKLEGDTSNLQGNSNTIPNSLGYLSGSMDGLTPEERAKRAADAAAAAAAEEAQRKADEEAAKKAEADNLAGKPAVDPAALLASAQADGKGGAGGLGKKFGALSSSMGGGSSLSGGAGMSGGVNRQFGGGGSLGKSAAGGRLTASKGSARPSYSKAGGSRLASSKTKGFARKQLANANAYSRRGSSASKGETASSDAGTAFDNNPGAGNVISGPGVGKGTGSSGGTDGGANPGGTSPGSQPVPHEAPVDCGPDKYQTAEGGCELVPVTGGQSANKVVDMLCKIAQGLLVAIAAIAVITAALDGGTFTLAYGEMLGGVMAALGGVIAVLGIAIMAMGDYAQGLVFTLTGGFIAATALIPYLRGTILNSGTMVIAAAAGLVLSQAAKMLDSKHGKDAPEAAQQ